MHSLPSCPLSCPITRSNFLSLRKSPTRWSFFPGQGGKSGGGGSGSGGISGCFVSGKGGGSFSTGTSSVITKFSGE